MNELAIIILNWNGHTDTIECIKSIVDYEDNNYPIYLLDNGSRIESVVSLENWITNSYSYNYRIIDSDDFVVSSQFMNSGLIFIKGKENLGFAKGNNIVWNKIKNDYNYVLLLNNDTIVDSEAITNMIDYMNQNKEVGAASCYINFYSDKAKLWNAGGYFTWYGDRKYYSQKIIDTHKCNGIKSISTPFITGCAMLVRKEVSNDVGIFTEDFFFGEEDFNYCKRLKIQGIKVETILDSVIYHKVGTSIKKHQKSINSFILHFSNRIINQKKFLSGNKWILWRELYILAISYKVMRTAKNINDVTKTVKNIRYYTSKYNEINFETFKEINSIK